MKTILFAVLFFSACSHFKSTPVARFEPSVPVNERSVSSMPSIDTDKLWIQVNDRKDSLIRSNPSHYWAWINQNTPSVLQKIADFQGQVVADAHYFNFGDVHSKDGSGLAVVDVDDSGKGSFYLDFVRYSIFVRAYLKNDYTSELFEAYTQGLAREKKNLPRFLKGPISKTRADLETENAKFVGKNLDSKYSLNNDGLGVMGYKDLVKQTFDPKKVSKDQSCPAEDPKKGTFNVDGKSKVATGKALGDLLVSSKKVKQVYDRAYLVNSSGSSLGMDRFWYSVTAADNKIRIIECKQLSKPATEYYAPQKPHTERIADVLNFYSDVKTDDSFVVNSPSDSDRQVSYWCRPKGFDFFKRSDVEDNRKDINEMVTYSSYLAYWMGYKQSFQKDADKLLNELKRNEKQVINDTVNLVVKYENHVFGLGKNCQK